MVALRSGRIDDAEVLRRAREAAQAATPSSTVCRRPGTPGGRARARGADRRRARWRGSRPSWPPRRRGPPRRRRPPPISPRPSGSPRVDGAPEGIRRREVRCSRAARAEQPAAEQPAAERLAAVDGAPEGPPPPSPPSRSPPPPARTPPSSVPPTRSSRRPGRPRPTRRPSQARRPDAGGGHWRRGRDRPAGVRHRAAEPAVSDERHGRSAADAAQPGAGEVTATVIVNAPAARVFAGVHRLGAAGRVDPVHHGTGARGRRRRGQPVEAVTTVGPAVLRDEMRVVRLDPPYEVRVVHFGRLLRGPGVMRCTPMGGNRTQVVWHEWFHAAGRAGRAGGLAGALAGLEGEPHPGAAPVRPPGRAATCPSSRRWHSAAR